MSAAKWGTNLAVRSALSHTDSVQYISVCDVQGCALIKVGPPDEQSGIVEAISICIRMGPYLNRFYVCICCICGSAAVSRMLA